MPASRAPALQLISLIPKCCCRRLAVVDVFAVTLLWLLLSWMFKFVDVTIRVDI